MKNCYFTLLFTILIFSCNQEYRDLGNSNYGLRVVDEISLPLDESTLPYTKALFSFRENEVDYLGYLNQSKNEILVYDLNQQSIHKKIVLEKEGENGVGSARGFMYFTKDSIFITSNSDKRLYLVNDNGRVVNKFSYRKTSDNKDTGVAFYSRTNINTPLVKVGNKIYLTNYIPGNYAALTPNQVSSHPLCVEFDIHTGEVNLLPLKFPKNYWKNDSKHEPSFARIYNGESFVYMWRYYDKLLITADHKSEVTQPLASQYFSKINDMPQFDDLQLYVKKLVETPAFFNIIYDNIRKFYYVFTYPGTEVEKGDDVMKLWQFLPVFSIIILDENFQKIGETKMPANTYHIENYFVTEKGLHISKSHPLNKYFTENVLKFDVFIPVKRK